MGVGQFCTNPGVVVIDTAHADAFLEAAEAALAKVAPSAMLTGGTAQAYRAGVETVAGAANVATRLNAACDGRQAGPALFVVSAADWLANPGLGIEMFGPAGIVIRTDDAGQVAAIAKGLHGQLTCTLQMDDADVDAARPLVPVLERKAGRLLVNAFPTGVEVADAMVHGGPFPASTNFGATSVGTLAIRRFLRPVCYQNMPDALLPADLRD